MAFSLFRLILTGVLLLVGTIVLVLMYNSSLLSHKYFPVRNSKLLAVQPNCTMVTQQSNKPVVLLWFWPENKAFDFQDCKKLFKITNCKLTDDKSLYSKAEAVLIFHKAIYEDLSNLPTSPRPGFQRWIWLNMDSPTNTRQIEGLQSLFNLTLSYRRDADIPVRWKLTAKKQPAEEFVLPKKKRLLCWILENSDLNTTSVEGSSYYAKLVEYIKVHVFNTTLKGERYFQTISSCKFLLSFENSIHKDYISEIFNGPLAAGTVPIVLGPPRKNYEDFAPGTAFIHVSDFPDPMKLADLLLRLDEDSEAYMKYFTWRQFYTVRRHLTEENHKYTHAICQACYHVGLNKEYRVVRDLYKWFYQ
uniref:Fucosyltransferase n=1 Tax=Echeneis naucrates TaxID=173247 RepID=A0A665TL58_ECHNA